MRTYKFQHTEIFSAVVISSYNILTSKWPVAIWNFMTMQWMITADWCVKGREKLSRWHFYRFQENPSVTNQLHAAESFKKFPSFMEPEGSWPFHNLPPYFPKIRSNIIFPPTPRSSAKFFLPVFLARILYAFLISPCVLHAPPISSASSVSYIKT
jgi:hypothetical protein